ncbi:MAG TPA: nitrous oxide reductase family maturation protein NosD [Gemmatimonadaceae bacterium]|nr:nitrous oxide reductase family maturation protein NosD [Gemmatimonadaceae bacterium]
MRLAALTALLSVLVACDEPPADPFAHGPHRSHGAHDAHASAAGVQAPSSDDGLAADVGVSPNGPVRSLSAAVRLVRSGGRIMVHPGTYREHGIVVDKPVEIVGHDYPTIDAEGAGQILTVVADDVTIRGLRLTHVGTSYVDDRAAIKVSDATGCIIDDNRVDDAFFGIYLANVTRCRISGNVVRGVPRDETSSGNGIHLWTSRDVDIERNQVSGHRDGIYFEFVHDTRIDGNLSEGNLRYGLHFMYSDGCRYTANTFRRNGSGVAVMFTKRVEMLGNTFENNWGPASYGLLLKEIGDSRLENNTFAGNTTGLLADGANRLIATHNKFLDNGWAVKLDASTLEARFTANDFLGNTFNVATNSREHTSSFSGNYWDDYAGYDLDHDGVGDVPFHPVRLFSLVVQQHPPAIALLRGAFVSLLDAAERALPSLTPETLVDSRPLMRRTS